LANAMFFSRLVRRLVHFLTTQTSSGELYEVDPRLRPDGSSGLLVTSTDGFERSQEEPAWTWEHQALVRARAVAGDENLRLGFETLRREVLMLPRDSEMLRHDIVEMRERMRESLANEKDGQFDLKQGLGGIADIEFMVQFGALNWAHKIPALTEHTDNIRLLEGLAQLPAETGFLSEEDAAILAEAYRNYRREVHRLALQDEKAIVAEDVFTTERGQVTRLWKNFFS